MFKLRSCVFAAFFLASPVVNAADSLWTASSGLRPDQLSSPWTHVDSSSSFDASLSPTALTLNTSTSPSDSLYYIQSDATLDMSQNFYIEGTLKRTTADTFSNNSTALTRRAASIAWTIAGAVPKFGALQIGIDAVFFQDSNLSNGPVATVDTNGAFHTYKISVDRTTGNAALFYDGSLTPLLTVSGFTYAELPNTDRIFWGESSSLVSGGSEWSSVSHNALSAVPEPLTAAGVLGLATRVLARRSRTSL